MHNSLLLLLKLVLISLFVQGIQPSACSFAQRGASAIVKPAEAPLPLSPEASRVVDGAMLLLFQQYTSGPRRALTLGAFHHILRDLRCLDTRAGAPFFVTRVYRDATGAESTFRGLSTFLFDPT